MPLSFDYLNLRRMPINYQCPFSACENEFSSTSEPAIILEPWAALRGPTGLLIEDTGDGILFNWDVFPGAICYSLYRAIDALDPFSEYILVTECTENTSILIPGAEPGTYVVTAITLTGETGPSETFTVGEPVPEECGGDSCVPPTYVVTRDEWALLDVYAVETGWIPPGGCDPVLTDIRPAHRIAAGGVTTGSLLFQLGIFTGDGGAPLVSSYVVRLGDFQYYFEVSFGSVNSFFDRFLWTGVRPFCINPNGAYQQVTVTTGTYGQQYHQFFGGFCEWVGDEELAEAEEGIASYSQVVAPACVTVLGIPELI